MAKQTVGIDLADLRLEPKEAFRAAARLQFRAVEMPASEGETSPRSLSTSGRRHLAHFVEGLGLNLPALRADFALLRLTDPASVQERIERTCEILELAADLKVPQVTSASGALTHPQSGAPSELAIAALRRIGEFADSRNVVFSLRPSHDAPDRLAAVLDAVRCPSVRLGIDPAALVMSGVNPLSPVGRFPDQVSLVHVRDATAGSADRPGLETGTGNGDVDWKSLFAALHSADFHGPLILRRTTAVDPAGELVAARSFLSYLL